MYLSLPANSSGRLYNVQVLNLGGTARVCHKSVSLVVFPLYATFSQAGSILWQFLQPHRLVAGSVNCRDVVACNEDGLRVGVSVSFINDCFKVPKHY